MSRPLLREITKLKDAGIEGPQLDAQLLLAHVLGVSREAVMFDPPELTQQQAAAFDALIARRAAREPMSHLLGMREFYGRDFNVTKDVLDPRPDTEILIDAVLEYLMLPAKSTEFAMGRSSWLARPTDRAFCSTLPPTTNHQSPITILDIGTGSGCILITLLKEIKDATGVGLDISEAALKVAFANKMHHDLEHQLELVHGNMSDILQKNSVLDGQRFDIITSNPPYIPAADIADLMPEVRDYEPHVALDGGKDGLDYYRQLAKSLAQLLKPNGLIFLEIGAGQAKNVVDIFSAEHWQLYDVRCDLAGHERCVIFQH